MHPCFSLSFAHAQSCHNNRMNSFPKIAVISFASSGDAILIPPSSATAFADVNIRLSLVPSKYFPAVGTDLQTTGQTAFLFHPLGCLVTPFFFSVCRTILMVGPVRELQPDGMQFSSAITLRILHNASISLNMRFAPAIYWFNGDSYRCFCGIPSLRKLRGGSKCF